MASLLLAVVIPVMFLFLDLLLKAKLDVPFDDIGADFCLFGCTLSSTNLLITAVVVEFKSSTATEQSAAKVVGIGFTIILVSFLLYIFSISILAPTKPGDGLFTTWLKNHSFPITVFLGLISTMIVGMIYVLYLMRAGEL